MIPWLHHDLVQRVFDDSLGFGLLEARNDGPNRGFIEDGIHCHPVFIT